MAQRHAFLFYATLYHHGYLYHGCGSFSDELQVERTSRAHFVAELNMFGAASPAFQEFRRLWSDHLTSPWTKPSSSPPRLLQQAHCSPRKTECSKMTARTSARLAKKGKQVKVDGGKLDTNAWISLRAANRRVQMRFMMTSNATPISKEEHQPPPRKRQRTTTKPNKNAPRKKQVRGKQGGLADLINMPIDIFTEIAAHLLPIDIINLARSNKFFRSLLMHRTSIHIWNGAMKNIEGLPPCPPGMSEPRYLSLLFSKTCTKCGGPARGKMDPNLLVRLCGSCRGVQ
ncbi:hypothetical protein AG1IA_04895 [Rhizoctonia solani AG-1 IA]|uniref:F-box domain-containing protein n=1 Tax=Thanatephorus cucumeris (strain AG1-IA) TaxID=983506 RepID=L8WSW3_THACA|nr:hypothetical protein AG1IA_04895 [Rhizoctonia solani AG-1 IA]